MNRIILTFKVRVLTHSIQNFQVGNKNGHVIDSHDLAKIRNNQGTV